MSILDKIAEIAKLETSQMGNKVVEDVVDGTETTEPENVEPTEPEIKDDVTKDEPEIVEPKENESEPVVKKDTAQIKSMVYGVAIDKGITDKGLLDSVVESIDNGNHEEMVEALFELLANNKPKKGEILKVEEKDEPVKSTFKKSGGRVYDF